MTLKKNLILSSLAISASVFLVLSCAKIDHNQDLYSSNSNTSTAIANDDCDSDGLTDNEELSLGTNPANPDTDNDGLPDGEEVRVYSSNPLVADTDFDGLSDGMEVNTFHTSPVLADTDGGGEKDGEEVKHGRKPLLNTDDKLSAPQVFTCN